MIMFLTENRFHTVYTKKQINLICRFIIKYTTLQKKYFHSHPLLHAYNLKTITYRMCMDTPLLRIHITTSYTTYCRRKNTEVIEQGQENKIKNSRMRNYTDDKTFARMQ